MAELSAAANTWPDPTRAADLLERVQDHLLGGSPAAADRSLRLGLAQPGRAGKPLQNLWKATELSAHDFAEQVGRFFGLRRVLLPELMAASALSDRFSHRFLRESA